MVKNPLSRVRACARIYAYTHVRAYNILRGNNPQKKKKPAVFCRLFLFPKNDNETNR